MSWFNLPGPSSYLALVEQDLRESKSVFAVVPTCFDDQWLYAMRSRLETSYEWMEVPETLQGFYQAISCRPDGKPFTGIREIIEHRITRRGFIVRNPPEDSWNTWIPFLGKFAEFNRAIDDLEKNVFLVVTDSLPNAIPRELLISERRIEKFIRPEDSFFHVARTSDFGDTNEIWRKIRMHVCSELALWDFQLCELLSELSVRQLLDPYSWLSEYGVKQGWKSFVVNGRDDDLRRAGLLFAIAGEEMTHSVLLALQGKNEEVLRRIWIAQIRVLFPIIEEQRLRLLEVLRRIHASTIKSWEREVGEDGELEIGFLHHRMSVSNAFGRDLTRIAEKLKYMRNNLAHLKICGPQDLLGEREWL